LAYFKEVEKHAFTLSHCWLKLKDFDKWKASFLLYFKNGKRTAEDNDQDTPSEGGAYAKRPRGHKASKTDLRREALAIALGNTLKSVFADKEEASARGMSKGAGTRRSTFKASPTYKEGPLKSNKGSSILRR
jgi:hypothetical protein